MVGLKTALGAVPIEGVYPLAKSFDTVGPMARTVADCALAHAVLTATEVPAPAIAGLRIGVLTAYPDLGPPEAPAERDERALAHVEHLRALGARGRASSRCRCRRATRGPSSTPTPPWRTRRPSPAGATSTGRSSGPSSTTPSRSPPSRATRAAARCAQWRARAAREPDVDLVLAPTLGYDDLPSAGVDELGVRLAFSAYARAFSYLGWPAIAIGAMQLAGRDAAVVIGAALALEREGAVR